MGNETYEDAPEGVPMPGPLPAEADADYWSKAHRLANDLRTHLTTNPVMTGSEVDRLKLELARLKADIKLLKHENELLRANIVRIK